MSGSTTEVSASMTDWIIAPIRQRQTATSAEPTPWMHEEIVLRIGSTGVAIASKTVWTVEETASIGVTIVDTESGFLKIQILWIPSEFVSAHDSFKADAVAEITAHAPDEALLKIAEELTALQTHARLVHGAHIHARITRSRNSHYVHSNTMDVETVYVDTDNEAPATPEELDQVMTRLMRGFADWIYKQLEDEDTWLNSNECIDERLNESDDEFDEDGSVV